MNGITFGKSSVPNYICIMEGKIVKNNKEKTLKIRGVVGQVSRIRERANRFIEIELKKRDLKGIVPAHGAILMYLFDCGSAVPTKDVVDYVRKSKSTVTGMINTLEKHGYIKRSSSASDSRVTLVELTEKSFSIKQDFIEISLNLNELIFNGISEDEIDKLEELLNKLETNLSR